MIYREQLLRIYNEMKVQRQLLDEELSGLPEGFLNMRTYGEKTYYTWQILPKGRRRKVFRKGITRDRDMINKLVRKRYLIKTRKVLDKNLDVVSKALDKYDEIDENMILGEFVRKHPELIGGISYGCTDNEEWAADYRMPVGLHEENLKSTAASGRKMRSKGEIIIASRLDYFKIPYRYEAPIPHPDINRVPDFTIKKPHDNKIFYWEHLGLVADSGYIDNNLLKLREYEQIGITPWNNLIITYDQGDGGIDVKIIDAMIQGYLL